MAYVKTAISVYGTEDDLLNAMSDFFENNGVTAYNVTKKFETDPHSVEIDINRLKVVFKSSGGTSASALNITVYTKISGEWIQVNNATLHYSSGNYPKSMIVSRSVNFLLIKNSDLNFIQYSSFNQALTSSSAQYALTFPLATGEIIFNHYSSGFVMENGSNDFTIYSHNMPPYDETKLILDNSVQAIYPNSDKKKYAEIYDISALNGAAPRKFYNIIGELYYCFYDVWAIKMGNEVIYNADN